jgi:hypothetical protein
VTARHLDLNRASSPLRHRWAPRRRKSGWNEGRARTWRRHLLLLPSVTAPPEQQARMETMPARYGRHRGRRIPSLGKDRALLLRRPRSACAGHHDVRRVHGSRHSADTAPTRTDCIQLAPSRPQGGTHRALTEPPRLHR